MAPAALKRYKSVQVTTSSPGEILILLYDGMFRFLGEAIAAMKAGERGRAGEKLDRAHAILGELVVGLDPKVAPELCTNLESVYMFCMGQLVEANLTQDPAVLADVVRVLTPLREAWTTIVREGPTQAVAVTQAAP